MPLIHSSSKSAREENIHREIEAGRDPKQAVAIGYSVQRQSMHHSDDRHAERVAHEKNKYGQ